MNLPGQQQSNTKLITLLLHLNILLPVVERTSQVHTIATIIPHKFSQHIIITIGWFDAGVFGIIVPRHNSTCTKSPWSLFILIGCCSWTMISSSGFPFFVWIYIIGVVFLLLWETVTPSSWASTLSHICMMRMNYLIRIIKFSWWFRSMTYLHSLLPVAEK